MKQIVLTPAATRQWQKLSADVRKRIFAKLTVYATSGSGDVKVLSGMNGCRLRVGDWRVIFIETADTVTIAAVGHRREIYDGEEAVMTVRFQKTPKGEVAILPRKEYEALIAKAAEAEEDAGAARIVARARKEIAAGAPLIPFDVVNRMADGENPISVLRKWRKLTQVQLSERTGIGQGYISDLEGGRRGGTTAALKKIATALNVPLDMIA